MPHPPRIEDLRIGMLVRITDASPLGSKPFAVQAYRDGTPLRIASLVGNRPLPVCVESVSKDEYDFVALDQIEIADDTPGARAVATAARITTDDIPTPEQVDERLAQDLEARAQRLAQDALRQFLDKISAERVVTWTAKFDEEVSSAMHRRASQIAAKIVEPKDWRACAVSNGILFEQAPREARSPKQQ